MAHRKWIWSEKARNIEIPNLANYLDWGHQNQPYIILHELAHSYHHRTFNFADPDIIAAYNHALSSGLYTNILLHTGGENHPHPVFQFTDLDFPVKELISNCRQLRGSQGKCARFSLYLSYHHIYI